MNGSSENVVTPKNLRDCSLSWSSCSQPRERNRDDFKSGQQCKYWPHDNARHDEMRRSNTEHLRHGEKLSLPSIGD